MSEMSDPAFNEAVVHLLYEHGHGDIAELDVVANGSLQPTRVAANQAMPQTEATVPHVAWAILYWAFGEGHLEALPDSLDAADDDEVSP